jgi:hypothetical protein
MDASAHAALGYFAPDYFAARASFLRFARDRGADIAAYPIRARGPGDERLSIDTAYLGARAPRRLLLVLSGTHGAEGFAGSAIQQQWLDRLDPSALPVDGGCLLIHAVNPYGFAWRRRANEHNVDLNRNALDSFPGPTNAAYRKLDAWLNPPAPPGRLDCFLVQGVWRAFMHGFGALRQAIGGGQYEFSRGLFYGGAQREESIVHLDRIVAAEAFREVERIIAIDLHTGLGPSATYRLLVDIATDHPAYRDLARWFGTQAVASSQRPGSAVYEVSGGIVDLIERRYTRERARVAVLEIGTVALPLMLYRLYRENRATFHTAPDSPALARERAALLDAFCPPSADWRGRVLALGDKVMKQAVEALRTEN